jgi:hypothetical protein
VMTEALAQVAGRKTQRRNAGNQPSARRAPPPPQASGRMMGRKTEIP